MSSRYAFATLVTSDHYLPGALALAAALREVHPTALLSSVVPFETVCITTPETVDVKTIKLLRKAFDVVIGVEVIEEKNEAGLKLLGRPDLYTVLTKLHVFRLTQYEKIIFLDADVLPIRPLSHLFNLPHEFSAVPDVGWPDIFNSGVMVLTPDVEKFDEVMGLVRSKGSWDGGDQGVLNEWRGDNWHRLSFTYNTTPTAAYTYAPAYEHFGSQISAIHFIGPNKPWKDLPFRAPSSTSQRNISTLGEGPTEALEAESTPQRTYAYGALVDRWFDVYDRHYRQEIPEPKFAEKRYENVWDGPAQNLQEPHPPPPPKAPLGLDELKQMAIQGGSSGSRNEGEGEYRTLPLEGRIDLMRPIRGAEEKLEVQTHAEQRPSGQPIPSGAGGEIHQVQYQFTQTLPTPGPSEVPPSPYIAPVSLPPSLPPIPGDVGVSQSVEQASFEPPLAPAPNPPTLEHRDSNTTPRPEDYHHRPVEHVQQTAPTSQQHYEPPAPHRPPSPPLLKWNPAVEPPPNEAPPVTAFRADAYFPNVWDLPPSVGKLHQDLTGQSVPDSTAFFQPPPPSKIPEQLIQEGHYSNVIGLYQSPPPQHAHHEAHHEHSRDHSHHDHPQPYPHPPPPHSQPDVPRFHKVFPWEEKPIHKPGRVFPEGDSAPPSGVRYIEDMPPEPEPEPAPIPTEESTVPAPSEEAKPGSPGLRIPIPPPQVGFTGSKGYSNAWDSVPSIQRYASRLVKPPPPPAHPPIPWSSRRRSDSYHSRGELSDVSMDGDVEDEVDDEEEGGNGRLSGSEVSDIRKGKKSGVRSPPSASGSSTRAKSGKKEFRSFGVQTIPKDVRSVAIQVSQQASSFSTGRTNEPPVPRSRKGSRAQSRQGSGTSSPATSTHLELPKPTTTLQELKLGQEQMAAASPSIANVQSFIRPPVRQAQQTLPSGMISPRLHDTYTFESPSRTPPPGTPVPTTPAATAKPASQSTKPPAIRTQNVPPMAVTRTPSTETADSSTFGPISPSDSPVVSSKKRVGRTWDPSTGVDVFKRTSEEVLARFLRMGSWEDESTPTHRA